MGLRDIGIADIVRRNAQQFGERVAFTVEGRSVSHRD